MGVRNLYLGMQPVCFLNTNAVWGGGEKWHYDLAIRLEQRGVPVLVVTRPHSALSQRLQSQYVKLQQVNISNLSFLNIFKILLIYHLVKKYHIRTIILNLSRDMKAAGIASKLAGVEKIIYRRGLARAVKDTHLNRFFFRHIISDVIANSEATKQKILHHNPSLMPREKISVIYNGIDLQEYDRKPSTKLYTRKPGEIVLGNAARLSPQKGQTYLIELARRLKTEGVKFRLLIAGKGELEQQLQQYAQALEVKEEIQFLGFQENIKGFMGNIDIFVLSSSFEGFGYALVEAMAAQKPVVAFHVSSNPEIVDHGHTGLLAEQENVEDLVQCVKELIHNEDLRKTLGQNARKRVEEQFEIQRVVDETLALINTN